MASNLNQTVTNSVGTVLVEILNTEVSNVLNVIIILKKENTKSIVGQHGPPTKAKVRSGAMEE
jgi:hypothetical protein